MRHGDFPHVAQGEVFKGDQFLSTSFHKLYKSRHHLTDRESGACYAASIFSLAKGTLSTNVCMGVFP